PEDTFVEFDHALNTAVKKIRIALGDCANSPEYVETVPKRGYRFLVPVEAVERPILNMPERLTVTTRGWLRSGSVRAVLLVCVLLLAGLVVVHWQERTSERRMVLAVLPLEDWSNDSSQELLCDGITQELITQSGKADPSRLAVVPRAASASYRHTKK